MNRQIQTILTPMRHVLITAVLAMWLWPVLPAALAAPGAHGPSGEHLDAKTGVAAGSSQPRMEAKSDVFELVATLYDGELSILIDRYETNEPVLHAELGIESGGVKAKARFHADHGDYAVDDPALLKILNTPGEHALVFTLVAGKESDLLDGTLVTIATTNNGHAHDDHGHALEIAAWTVFGLGIIGLLGWWLKRRKTRAVTGKGA